jgi:hypothetical protein
MINADDPGEGDPTDWTLYGSNDGLYLLIY